MNKRHMALYALILASPFADAAFPPAASGDARSELSGVSATVDPSASSIRHDVRAICPEIDVALQRLLAPAWGRVQEAATMRVKFRIEGDRVVDVSTAGPFRDYRSDVRRAVMALECVAPAGSGQTFEFVLSIRAPQELPRADRLAMQVE